MLIREGLGEAADLVVKVTVRDKSEKSGFGSVKEKSEGRPKA